MKDSNTATNSQQFGGYIKTKLWCHSSYERNGHFGNLRCPKCQKCEAFFYFNNEAGILFCNRLDKCGARTLLKQLQAKGGRYV